MAELSREEADVFSVTRRLARRLGRAPSVEAVRIGTFMKAREVDRALASLTAKGLLSKPRRGYYLPNEEDAHA